MPRSRATLTSVFRRESGRRFRWRLPGTRSRTSSKGAGSSGRFPAVRGSSGEPGRGGTDHA
ncbi:MAG: hypothetical protein MZV64_28475 [Ignavibacteriales bacterium]|nr:hypothetical protein [Ignavibacteriales bacterium]